MGTLKSEFFHLGWELFGSLLLPGTKKSVRRGTKY